MTSVGKMRWLLLACVVAAAGCGFGGKKSTVLMERHARGPLEDLPAPGEVRTHWDLEPDEQSQTQGGVTVTLTYASPDYLREFFDNKEIFGSLAGENPFYAEHFVFMVTLHNEREDRVHIIPDESVIVDDRGNQYATIGAEYVLEFARAKKPIMTLTRGVLTSASPGFYGFSLPVGKIIPAESETPSILMMQSMLQAGYLYSGVTYDGLIAFRSPTPKAKRLRFHLMPIKAAFDSENLPREELRFVFDFDVTGGKDLPPIPLDKQAAKAAEKAKSAAAAEPEASVAAEPEPDGAEAPAGSEASEPGAVSTDAEPQ